jgi:hypothetical protein
MYAIMIFNPNASLPVDYREGYRDHSYKPYSLPIGIKNKICLLMDRLNLVSGSIDMIIDLNNELYFIEVNPQGQYDWVSVYGNYELDKKIAFFLQEKDIAFHEK